MTDTHSQRIATTQRSMPGTGKVANEHGATVPLIQKQDVPLHVRRGKAQLSFVRTGPQFSTMNRLMGANLCVVAFWPVKPHQPHGLSQLVLYSLSSELALS
jgi:hypothetical protein